MGQGSDGRVWWGIGLSLALAYTALAAASPLAVGIWQDDAIYVVTGRALAAGEGYRHEELASRPLQTKYPILYPAVLALSFRASPDFPGNRALWMAPTALSAAALVVLSMLYCRAAFRFGRREILVLSGFAAAAPALVAFVRYPMSDLVYGALAVAALVCLDVRRESAPSRASALGWTALGGLLVGLAVLTRSIGVSLAFAAVVLPLVQRRLAHAGVAALALAVCAGPWWIWQAWAAGQNGDLQSGLLEGSDLSYALWIPPNLGEPLRIVAHNLLRSAVGLAHFQLAFPRAFVGSALAGDTTAWMHVLVWPLVLALLVGFARSLRQGVRTLHVYAIAYAGMVLVWPFEPYRFLLPWTPFLLAFLGWGLLLPGRGRLLAVAAAATLAVLFAVEDGRLLASSDERYYLRERLPGVDLVEVEALERWIGANTPESAVIASAWPARFYLTTGRRGVVTWPDRDPYTRYYGRDRSTWTFTAVPARSETIAMARDMRAHWRDAWQGAGVSHYVESRDMRDALVFAASVRGPSKAFEEMYETPGEGFRVYRIDWDVQDSEGVSGAGVPRESAQEQVDGVVEDTIQPATPQAPALSGSLGLDDPVGQGPQDVGSLPGVVIEKHAFTDALFDDLGQHPQVALPQAGHLFHQ